jgi:hypothetical protein
MAETLSYQEPQNVTTVDNLTPEEQDSLAVGESISQQEEQLYAGKYKNAQELEKAYVELQAKLGEKTEEKTETASADEQPEDTPKMSEGATLITDASKEYYDNGNKLSPETMAKFSSMSSQDLLKAYMEVSQNPEFQAQQGQPSDISQSDINQIKNSAGGDQAYANIINWAKSNLPQEKITAFDEVVNTGSIQAIQLAVSGLKSEYDNANGVEGRMVTGKAPQNSGDVFRSQQELVAAMNDPRYDRDPAYRQDVVEKLDRSNLEF